MKARFNKDKDFKNELIKHFERGKKSGYGKLQIVNIIKDFWIKHLEMLMENRKED